MKEIKVNEKFKRNLYSVTALTLCLVTLFSFWLANRNNGEFIPEGTDVISQKDVVTAKDVQVNTPVPNIPDERYDDITTEAPVTLSVEFVFPLKGSVSKTFSRDELVKNVTTGDWRIHKGIDINGASGDRINAIDDGVVTELVHNAIWGTIVTVDHGNGFITYYLHMNSRPIVSVGQKVSKGQQIGYVGMSGGTSTGYHLDIRFYVNGNFFEFYIFCF